MQDAVAIVSNPDYIRVRFSRPLASLEEAQALQEELERRVPAAGVGRVLFDHRGIEPHPDAIAIAMLQWARDSQLAGTSVVVDTELARVRINMTALAQRVAMRAFVSEVDAIRWLLDPEQRRPTREVKQL